MRFDDRLLTMLNYPANDVGGKTAVWTQLVDLIAQDRGEYSAAIKQQAIARLREWRYQVPDRRRLASAVSIAGKDLPVELVAVFAADLPPVAAPVLVRAKLDAQSWQELIMSMPPSSRALLRERRDLPEEAMTALRAFGTSDFALPSAVAPVDVVAPAAEKGEAQPTAVAIDELVKRIDAYREARGADPGKPVLATRFAFESDPQGIFNWVDGAPRGALLGLALGELAQPGGFGFDGQATGAFRKRAPIREARLTVPGNGPSSGEWRLSAQPFFDASTGRFLGYRGVGRRPIAAAESALTMGMRPDSVRQLVHELRTPLNAIRGFAEMIEGEFLGSVEPIHRERAQSIIDDSARLLRVFEDLDISARLASNAVERPQKSLTPDAGRVVRETARLQDRLVQAQQVRLQVFLPDEPISVEIEETALSRMVDRLLLCVVSSAREDEVLRLSLSHVDAMARIEASRPASLASFDAAVLLDPANGVADASNPAELPLGLAFTLRLLRQMARREGGRFEILDSGFILSLPCHRNRSGEAVESI